MPSQLAYEVAASWIENEMRNGSCDSTDEREVTNEDVREALDEAIALLNNRAFDIMLQNVKRK